MGESAAVALSPFSFDSRHEGATGFALIPLLPGTEDPTLKAWEAKWKQEYPNLPAG